MKIWVVGRNYPDKTNNFQGSFELEQAKMLAKRGHDVIYIACVLHPFWRIKDGGFVEFEDEKVRIFAYSGFFTPHMTDSLIQAPYFSRLREKKWKELLCRIENVTGFPKVIHIHYPLLIMAATVFENYHVRGVRIVVTEHWSKVLNRKLDNYEKRQMQMYLSFVDVYSCVGWSLKKAIIDIAKTQRKIYVIPNVVNDAFEMNKELHDGFRFGIIGRLVADKQIDKVIITFDKIFKSQKNTKLIIVGEGKERKKLVRLCERLEICDKVFFLGSLGRKETADVVKALDCLVCFSKYETFGVPIIEAWASGVPTITTTADSIIEEWDDKMGITVNASDIEDLESAMLCVVDKKDQYNKEYIAEFARTHFSEDAIYKKLIQIYNNICDGDKNE